MQETMKNPAKPGDFGTNGTRDVVGSGMSETTGISPFNPIAWGAASQSEREIWLRDNPAAWGGDRPNTAMDELRRRFETALVLLTPGAAP